MSQERFCPSCGEAFVDDVTACERCGHVRGELGTGPPTPRGRGVWPWLAGLAVLGMVAAWWLYDSDRPAPEDVAGADTPASLLELFPQGRVVLGIANEIPYAYEGEDGEITGAAPEVARAVLGELGITQLEAVMSDFGELIPNLQAGQFDILAAGMAITPERAEQVIFSDPDYCVAAAFVVPAGNPAGLTDFASVAEAGIRLGVGEGAVEVDYALGAGVPDANLIRFEESGDLVEAVERGGIDAVALSELTAQRLAAALEGFEPTEPFIPLLDGEEQLTCGAFAFVDQEVRDIFNAKLNEFQAEDGILPIVQPFGFSATAVETASRLTVEDLID